MISQIIIAGNLTLGVKSISPLKIAAQVGLNSEAINIDINVNIESLVKKSRKDSSFLLKQSRKYITDRRILYLLARLKFGNLTFD